MTVRVEVHQERSVIEGPLYRVLNTVTYSTGITSSIFVFDTETALFSHVATPWDIEQYPATRVEAQENLVDYYRQASATLDCDTVSAASEAATYVLSRVESLVNLYDESQVEFEGVDDHIYEAE